jgi:hypothetical protein
VSAPGEPIDVAARWLAAWPGALAAWSSYTQLRTPQFYGDDRAALRDGMAGEIAAIRLRDQVIMVNLETIRKRKLEDHALAVLAHEIGHHVYAPGNLTDDARMLAAMNRVLVGLPPRVVKLAGNLYQDLLINDRLQRRVGIDVAAVYRKLADGGGSASETWKVYARTYEHLWRLAGGSLAPPGIDGEMDADAMLLARIVRHFAGDWLKGARRFAAVLYRCLAKDEQDKKRQTFERLGLHDTRNASAPAPGEDGPDAIPDGLASIDPTEVEDDGEFDGDILDPLGERRASVPKPRNTAPEREGPGRPGTQHRSPFEYGQLLKALGLDLSAHEVTTRYYRERALPHLIPFPSRRAPQATEPVAEGYEEWASSDALDALDVIGSVLQSPHVIPGVTTLQRVYGEAPGADPAPVPMDLDIYVDCSGSMPNPAVDVSYLALAGTILALSALRAGARVQATLWSGPGQFETTGGFVRDEKRILAVVTGYLCGSTAFPLHVLRDTYDARKPTDPQAHVVVISDDGVTTMLACDERGESGDRICARALARARGGGTLVLNLPRAAWKGRKSFEALGFRVSAVTRWDDLVAFAREFVRENYVERT